MKLSRYSWFALICLCFSSGSYAAVPEQPAKEDLAKKSTTIEVKKSDPHFELELKANHTTGYNWFLGQVTPNLIEPVKHVYKASDGKLIGSGGVEIWTFKVDPKAFTIPQIITVEMIYARPWAVEETARTKTFKIVTRPSHSQ